MPIQQNNIIMAGARGTILKQVVFRQRNGKTFISAYPDMSKRKLSPKQLKIAKIMGQASEYAKSIISDPEKFKDAMFRLDLPKTRVYNALVKEYFKQNYKPD